MARIWNATVKICDVLGAKKGLLGLSADSHGPDPQVIDFPEPTGKKTWRA